MATSIERVVVLNGIGEGLLARLSKMHARLNVGAGGSGGGSGSSATVRKNPNALENSLYERCVAAFVKRYPELPAAAELERTPGFHEFQTDAKAIYSDLEPHYNVFVDLVAWRPRALEALTAVANEHAQLSPVGPNADVAREWLNLLARFVKLHLYLAEWGARQTRALTATYAVAYHSSRALDEPHFRAVAALIVRFDHSIVPLADEFGALAERLQAAVGGDAFMAYARMRAVADLRKSGALSLTLRSDELALPAADHFVLRHMLRYDDLYEWALCALLVCPALLANADAQALLKALLGDGFVATVYRGVTYYPHERFDELCKASKDKAVKKLRSAISDWAKEAAAGAFARHRERRVFLTHALGQLHALLSAQPGVLAPKVGVVVAALNLACAEARWYVRHIATPPPPSHRRYKPDEQRDAKATSLLYYTELLVALVHANASLVTAYYQESLAGADAAAVGAALGGANTAPLARGADALRRFHEALASGRGAADDYAAALRAWLVAQSQLTHPTAFTTAMRAGAALETLHLAAQRAHYAGTLDVLLSDHCSLRALWHYRDAVFTAPRSEFDRALEAAPVQPGQMTCYVRMLATFSENATIYYTKEREKIGKESVNIANKLLIRASKRACFLLHEIAMAQLRLDHVLADVNATHNVFVKVSRDWRPPRDYKPPRVPGAESALANRGAKDVQSLFLMQRNCWQLCRALNEFFGITIYNHVFSPREYLREKLAAQLTNFVRNVWHGGDDNKAAAAAVGGAASIERPSVVERRLDVYIGVLLQVEDYVDINMEALVVDVLLKEVYVPALGAAASTEHVENNAAPGEKTCAAPVVRWYAEFVRRAHASSSAAPAVYSALRGGWATASGASFDAESYADASELRALVRVFGAYAYKLLEKPLLVAIDRAVAALRQIVKANRAPLADFSKRYLDMAAVERIVKALKDVDGVVAHCIAIGNGLNMRRMLRAAVGDALRDVAPDVYAATALAYAQYAPNYFGDKPLHEMDCLAAESGVDVDGGGADPALAAVLKRSADAQTWAYLPFMFAVTLYSKVWQDAVYNSAIDAWLNNMAALGRAMCDLLLGFKALDPEARGNAAVLTQHMAHFTEMCAAQMLHIVSHPTKKQDARSMVVFVDKLCQWCPLLTREHVEATFPYILIRSHYTDAYSAGKVHGKQTETY